MRKWGVEDKGVAARGSAVTHKQWQRQRIGEGKCACQVELNWSSHTQRLITSAVGFIAVP